MHNSSDRSTPDESRIERLLSSFKPQPTHRFYKKMSAAPWQKSILATPTGISSYRKPSRRFVWGLAGLFVIIIILSVATVPPVRAIARQIFFSFIHAPSNQLEAEITLTRPGDSLDFSDPANFTLSVDEVRQKAGFVVKQISTLPAGLSLIGSRFDSSYNTVTLLYLADTYKLFLTQRSLGNSQDVFSIGASANVELVKIGDIQGEFVKGGWKVTSVQPTSVSQTQATGVDVHAIWDNDLPQYTLRWQAAGIAYELRTLGEGAPAQSGLIFLANELK